MYRLVLYFLLCLLAYLPAIQGKFLWDDLYLVGGNPFFRSPRFVLDGANVEHALVEHAG